MPRTTPKFLLILTVTSLALFSGQGLFQQGVSAKPLVQWTPPVARIDVPKGSNRSYAARFLSSVQLEDVSTRLSSEIAPVISVRPSDLTLVTPNQEHTIEFDVSVPPTTPVGTISGTLLLVSSKKGIAQPLKIEVNVQDPVEETVASTEQLMSSGFGRISLPGTIDAEISASSLRPAMLFGLESVRSFSDSDRFAEYLSQNGLPLAHEPTFLKISAEQTFPGSLGLKVAVPQGLLDAMPAGSVPELYIESVQFGADDEELGEWLPLQAEYNPESKVLTTSLSGLRLNPLSFIPPSTLSSAQLDDALSSTLSVSARIRVALTNSLTRAVPITGTFSTPDSDAIEAGVRDTIMLSGNLKVEAPLSLSSPTVNYEVTSSFGPNHSGLDLRAANGDWILAARNGVIDFVGNQAPTGRLNRFGQPQSGGFVVRVRHEDGSTTGYAHLIEDSNFFEVGQAVNAGDPLALGDSTGGVTGPHLHMSYAVNGVRVDPATFIGTTPGELPPAYLNKLSVVAAIDGSPVESTRRSVTQETFTYQAPLQIPSLPGVESGKSYALTINAETTDGQGVPLYRGRITIRPTAMRVVLTWDRFDTDVDLRVRDSLGRESWYGNFCGIPNGCLDRDDVDGFGPETFSLTQFAPSVSYSVFVNYYSDHGNGPTNATVRVYVDDALVTTTGVTLVNGQTVSIGTYPSAAATQINRSSQIDFQLPTKNYAAERLDH